MNAFLLIFLLISCKARILILCQNDTFRYFEDYVRNVFGSDVSKCLYKRPVQKYCSLDASLNDSIVCLQHTPSEYDFTDVDANGKLALVVTEQLTTRRAFNTVVTHCKRYQNITLINYSPVNAEIIRSDGCPGHRVLTLPNVPCGMGLDDYARHRHEPKIFDIAFIGARSDRRDRIFQQLSRRFAVRHITNKWNGERNQELARSKILVNVHYREDYRVFETLRCMEAVLVGVVVLSEDSLPQNQSSIEALVHFAPYDNIVAETILLMSRFHSVHQEQLDYLNKLRHNSTQKCIETLAD